MTFLQKCASVILSLLLYVPTTRSYAQSPSGGICKPIAERTSELGCFIIATHSVGSLNTDKTFWHLDTFETSAAATAAKTETGVVVESLGKVWLLTIEKAGWRPVGGQRASEIGPIPVLAGQRYTAQYMEAIFAPGMTAPTHTHPGPEAWYTLAGETCLETPAGKQIGRAGGPAVIIPAGPPMHLTATGTETRKAIVLILHDAAKPATTAAHDHSWKPKGLCKS
jgi:quercetin dioxygenase-like cupin family protein